MSCIEIPCEIKNGHMKILLPVEFLNPNDNGNPAKYTALVDTGAAITCITEEILKEIGPLPYVRCYGAKSFIDGETMCIRISCAQLSIPKTDFLKKKIEVAEIPNKENFQVILGMDILSQSTFSFENNIFTLCL